MMAPTPMDRLRALPIWRGPVRAELLGGGITNVNFVAEDDEKRVVVRIGDDIPVHGILRFNEVSASRAAHMAGISPAVIHAGPGALVIAHVEGRTWGAADLHDPVNLASAVDLIARTHREVPCHLRGPVLAFWVFHVIRDYAARLVAEGSPHAPLTPGLLREAGMLEAAVGPVDVVFGHNDLLPANFIHDGVRLWLVDWDYAGFNSPLFDLGGLAANCALDEATEARLLTTYFDRPPDADLWRRYLAMKAAAALRETLWSMVSETHSSLDFDYAAYSKANLATWATARDRFIQS